VFAHHHELKVQGGFGRDQYLPRRNHNAITPAEVPQRMKRHFPPPVTAYVPAKRAAAEPFMAVLASYLPSSLPVL
jgi:hypothetical protein